MKLWIGSIFAVCFLVAGIFLATPSTKGQKEHEDEPTVVQKGHVTEKEREYSKEYQRLYSDRKGQKLSGLAEMAKRKGKGQIAGVSIGIPTVPTIGNTMVLTQSEFLGGLGCTADAVILGVVRSKSSHLTVDETFVYTEYEFLVSEVLKNNTASPVDVNSNIQITRPGGLIKLDDQIIRVEDKLYDPLQIKKEYLLFLRFVPSANGYVVSDAKGDFVLEGNSFGKLSKLGVASDMESIDESQTFLAIVRSSISAGCVQKSTGGN